MKSVGIHWLWAFRDHGPEETENKRVARGPKNGPCAWDLERNLSRSQFSPWPRWNFVAFRCVWIEIVWSLWRIIDWIWWINSSIYVLRIDERSPPPEPALLVR